MTLDDVKGVRGDGVPMTLGQFLRSIIEPHATTFTKACPWTGCGGTMDLLPRDPEFGASDRYRCRRCGNVKAY